MQNGNTAAVIVPEEKFDPFQKTPTPEDQQRSLVEKVITWAKGLVFTSPKDLEAGADGIRRIKERRKAIQDHHRPIIDAAHKAHKVAVAKEKELLAPLDEAERIIRNGMDAYLTEQRRKEEEQRRQLEEQARQEARAKVEAAKTKIAALIGEGKAEAEQIAILEEALNAETTTDEEAVLIRSQLEVLRVSAEDRATAAAVAQYEVEMELMAPVVAPVPVAEKVEGVSSVAVTAVMVLDLKELCRAIAEGTVPEKAVKPDNATLRSLAKAGMKLPGCRVETKQGVRVR